MEENFTSPIKKLSEFFHKSRDKWKERAKKSTKEIKGYKKRIIFLETSKSELKSKNIKLKEEINTLINHNKKLELELSSKKK